MYSSMVDTNGKLKDIHSAYEGESEKGKEKVNILNENGSFTADQIQAASQYTSTKI